MSSEYQTRLVEILKRLISDVDDNMEFLGTVFNPKDHAEAKVSKSMERAVLSIGKLNDETNGTDE